MTWHASPSTFFLLTLLPHEVNRSLSSGTLDAALGGLFSCCPRDSVPSNNPQSRVTFALKHNEPCLENQNGAQNAIQSQKRRKAKNRDPHLPAQQTPPLARRSSGPQQGRHPGQSRRKRSRSQSCRTDRFSPRSLHRPGRRRALRRRRGSLLPQAAQKISLGDEPRTEAPPRSRSHQSALLSQLSRLQHRSHHPALARTLSGRSRHSRPHSPPSRTLQRHRRRVRPHERSRAHSPLPER